MKDTFTKWYLKFDKSGNTARIENRLKIITDADLDESAPPVTDFIEYAIGTGENKQNVYTYFASKVATHEGESHSLSNQEVNILCCGIIGEYSQNEACDDHLKTNLILNVIRHRENLPPMISEIAYQAKQFLVNESISDREYEVKKSPIKKNIAEILDPHIKQNNISAAGPLFLQILESLQKDVSTLSRQVECLREENQLLWWEKTQKLLSLDLEIAQLNPNHRIICCAFDLYELSLYSSMPISAQQLILNSFKKGQSKVPKNLNVKSLIDGINLKIATKIFESLKTVPESLRGFCQVISLLEDAYKDAKLKQLEIVKLPKQSEIGSKEFSVEDIIDLVLSEISLVMIGE